MDRGGACDEHAVISMIEHLVRYLRQQCVPFRLLSYPAPEPLPEVAFPRPRSSQTVDTYVVLVDGRPALACVPAGEHVDVVGLGNTIGSAVTDAGPSDLPAPYSGAMAMAVPPLGELLGIPLFVDSRITQPLVLFRAFAADDFVEISIEDFLRIEHPRVAAFAVAGQLPRWEPS